MQTSELVLKLGKQGADYADVVVLLTDMPYNHMQSWMRDLMQQLKSLGIGQVTEITTNPSLQRWRIAAAV